MSAIYNKENSFKEFEIAKNKDIALSKKKGEISKKEKELIFKKDLLEKVKKNKIYKNILEKFSDAELIDIEIEKKNND